MLKGGVIWPSLRYHRYMWKRFSALLRTSTFVLGQTALFLIAAPGVFAAAASQDSVQGYILWILQFINFILLPLLFSIALLFFLINAARYFIFKGDSDSDREKARTLALYGIGAFVFLVSIWGLVNMFVSGLGIDSTEAICPDYLDDWCTSKYESDPWGEGTSFEI